MVPVSERDDDCRATEAPLSLLQAQHRALSPSTAWEAPSAATRRYLTRQHHRAETQLNLEAAIVQDHRGWLALWTRER